MAGINDLSFTGPTQGGIKPNALAGAWSGSDAGGGFGGGFAMGAQDGMQQGYPDWRRWLGMRRGGGFLSRTNAAQPMAGAAQPDMGRPMSQAAAPAPFTAPKEPMAAPAPSPSFVGDSRAGLAPQQVQPNALWNSGIRKGGFLG